MTLRFFYVEALVLVRFNGCLVMFGLIASTRWGHRPMWEDTLIQCYTDTLLQWYNAILLHALLRFLGGSRPITWWQRCGEHTTSDFTHHHLIEELLEQDSWVLPLQHGCVWGSCSVHTPGHVCMQGSSSGIMDALWPKDSQGRVGIFKHASHNMCMLKCALAPPVYYRREVEDYLWNYLRKGLCYTVCYIDLTNPIRTSRIIQCRGHRCFQFCACVGILDSEHDCVQDFSDIYCQTVKCIFFAFFFFWCCGTNRFALASWPSWLGW